MRKDYSGYINFIKLTIFCFIVGFVVTALFNSQFWGVFTGVFVFIYYYLDEMGIMLNKKDAEKITKNKNNFFNNEFYKSLVNSLWLLSFTALLTFIIMEFIIKK